jgi:microcystin degradation protein MlrC
MAVKPAFYTDVGLDPWKADICVVKNFFPFRLFFAKVARKTLYVETEGATDLDAAFALELDGPIWPRDPVHEWRSRDALRRRL